MKRGYTSLEYKAKIRKLRKVRPNISLSTDLIIGFPGETEQDFADTLSLIDAMGFDFSFSFIYSPRPGTPASQLPDNVPSEVKKHRLSIVQKRIMENARVISESMVGTIQNVLVDRSDSSLEQMRGRTENNRVVNFIGNSELIGKFVPVRIQEALTYSLKGEMV
jgi:tRNA-2-methylthio-N6-dimethylallyladenosine synthase